MPFDVLKHDDEPMKHVISLNYVIVTYVEPMLCVLPVQPWKIGNETSVLRLFSMPTTCVVEQALSVEPKPFDVLKLFFGQVLCVWQVPCDAPGLFYVLMLCVWLLLYAER
jgi:hypothetical protein